MKDNHPGESPTLREWQLSTEAPPLTAVLYKWRTMAFSQREIARLCMIMTGEYVDCYAGNGTPTTPEEVEVVRDAERDFYVRVALWTPCPVNFAASVGHWVGLFIDPFHDSDPKAGGFTKWNSPEKRTWESAMTWAYHFLTDYAAEYCD